MGTSRLDVVALQTTTFALLVMITLGPLGRSFFVGRFIYDTHNYIFSFEVFR